MKRNSDWTLASESCNPLTLLRLIEKTTLAQQTEDQHPCAKACKQECALHSFAQNSLTDEQSGMSGSTPRSFLLDQQLVQHDNVKSHLNVRQQKLAQPSLRTSLMEIKRMFVLRLRNDASLGSFCNEVGNSTTNQRWICKTTSPQEMTGVQRTNGPPSISLTSAVSEKW
jgi:hypothetical protein